MQWAFVKTQPASTDSPPERYLMITQTMTECRVVTAGGPVRPHHPCPKGFPESLFHTVRESGDQARAGPPTRHRAKARKPSGCSSVQKIQQPFDQQPVGYGVKDLGRLDPQGEVRAR